MDEAAHKQRHRSRARCLVRTSHDDDDGYTDNACADDDSYMMIQDFRYL